MSAIETLRDALFGNPPSPTTKPSREGVLRAFTELNDAVGLVITPYVAVYSTGAELNADLAHAAGGFGLVYSDGDDTGVYVKIGASGTGSWTQVYSVNTLTDRIEVLEADFLALGDLAAKDTIATADIDANAVTNAKLADMAQATFKGRQAGAGTGDPQDMTATQAKVALALDLVDNTSDEDKPVSAATATALDGKADQAEVDDLALAVSGTPVLTDRYAHVLVGSANGSPLLAVNAQGNAIDAVQAVPALSDRWAYVLGDDMLAWTFDGEPFAGPFPNHDWRVEIRGATDSARHVYVSAPGLAEIRVTPVAGAYRGALIRGQWLSWLDTGSGAGILSRRSFSGATAFSGAITEVHHILGSGQSLSNGATSTPITVSPPAAGRIEMFDAGIKATGTSQSAGWVGEVISDADVDSLVDAYNTEGEVPLMQAAVRYLPALAANIGVIISNHGIGGQSYTNLKRGTVPYSNLLKAAQQGAWLAQTTGRLYRAPFADWIHGEADNAASKATYQGYLVEYQEDITEDIDAIRPVNGEVILVLDQLSSWTDYGVATSQVPLAQLQVQIDTPAKFVCVGPKYMLPTSDGQHLTANSSANLGYRHGRAMAQKRAGSWTGPLYALSAVRTGASVVLTFNMPFGGAAIDLATSLVSNPGNYGVEWFDAGDGNSVTISSVAATASNQVTVTLSGTPTGTAQKIGIAYTGTAGADAGPTTGARSCIRSATGEADAFGTPADHYACHQLINVT